MNKYTYDIYSNNRSNGVINDDDRYDSFYNNGTNNSRGVVGRKDSDRSVRYSGEKRKIEERYRSDRKYSPATKKRQSSTRESSKDDKEDEIPEDEVVVPDTLMDSVEKLRSRKEVKRNAADEDIEKLVVFCFTGKAYSCRTCGLLMTKKSAFKAHLISKSHVFNVIEARTANTYKKTREILDMDLSPDDWFEKNGTARQIIMKQSRVHMKIEREIKKREEENYNRTPSNFYQFKMESRKSVAKKEDTVTITSVIESSVEVKEFGDDRLFGCEFVRSVTSFHCRLCSVNLHAADEVVPHVDSYQHKENYATYTRKNPQYESMQRKQNKELRDIMVDHDGKDIVISESDKAEGSCFLSRLDSTAVRIPTVMNPELKEKEKREMEKKEKEKKEKEKKEKEKKEKEKKEMEKKEKETKEKESKEKEKKEKEKKEKEKKEKEKKEKKENPKEVKEKDKKCVTANSSATKTEKVVTDKKEGSTVSLKSASPKEKEVMINKDKSTLDPPVDKEHSEVESQGSGQKDDGTGESIVQDAKSDTTNTEITEETTVNCETTETTNSPSKEPLASDIKTDSSKGTQGGEGTTSEDFTGETSGDKSTEGNFMDGFEVVDEVKEDTVS